jgi:hypothetical protein
MHASTLVTRLADLTSVVGGEERADDEVPDTDGLHLGADLLDDTDVFMSHHLVFGVLDAAGGHRSERRCRTRSAG